MVNGRPVPVHETEFARDSVFGFSTAFLPDYVEEKTGGRILAGQVERFGLADVRGDLGERLRALADNACCVVDAEQPSDLDAFARQVLAAAADGKRFLFRSAASLLTALADLPPQPVAPGDMARFTRGGRPGVVLVGSRVDKTTRQLRHLMDTTDILPLEVELDRMLADEDALVRDLLARIIAFVTEAAPVQRNLARIGEPTAPPPIAPPGPPGWDDDLGPMPDWDLLGQPEPDAEFDQRVSW